MDITKLPNKILNKRVEKVSVDDIKNGSLEELILEMKNAMQEYHGVGLAANQTGRDLSVFIIEPKLAEESNLPEVYINPEITEYSRDDDEMEEGCLSIPDYFIPVKRAKNIKIKFINQRGEKMKLKVKGFAARVLQHETDHLYGLTIKNRK